MKTVRGTIAGPLVVERDLDVQGTVAGDAVVRPARTLHVRGTITGNLTVEQGATAVIYGTVNGRVRKVGGTLVITHPEPHRRPQPDPSGREAPSNRASSSTSKV
jgi:cytoskeletal protein CcmA (bactofilin family)